MVLILPEGAAPPPPADPLAERARLAGGRFALVDRGAGFRLSWRDLDGLASDWASRLVREGVRPGDRVAAVEPAGARLAALLWACHRSGAVLVPLSARSPKAEQARNLAACRPRLLLHGGEIGARDEGAPSSAPGDLCVLFSSGTASAPKPVRLTFTNHRASALGCQESLATTPEDRWLLCLPAHHVGGLSILFRSALSDQPVIAMPRFDAGEVLETIERGRPTLVSLVPTMVVKLIQAGGVDALRRCRALLVGGAPAPAEAVREWAALGLRACASYGLTESCSQVAVVPPGRAAELAGSAGFVHSQAAVEIEAGEIVVGGPVVSPGYLEDGRPAGAARGRIATGDLGHFDDRGALVVTGRRDDAIITGGENVQPEAVETVLRAHPEVHDAAVVGRPDPVYGQVLEALIVGGVDGLELIEWSRARLPPHQVPRLVRHVEALPRSEGGKLLRRLL